MKKKILDTFKNWEIGAQLNFTYVVAIFVPIFLVGMFLLINTYNILLNYHKDLLNSSNSSTQKLLFEMTTQIYNVSDSIAYDERTIDVLGWEYGNTTQFRDAARNYTVIDTFLSSYAQIDSITIYSDNTYVDDFKNFKHVTEDIENSDWYQKAINQFSPFIMLFKEETIYGNGRIDYNLALVRKITVLGSDYNAVMVIKLSENYLQSRLDTDQYLTIVSYENEEVFYSDNRLYYGKKMPFSVDYMQKNFYQDFIVDFDGSMCLGMVSSVNPSHSTDRIYVATIDKQAIDSIIEILIITFLIALLAIILPVLLIRIFTSFFIKQVNTLREEMHKASSEDYNIQTEFSGSYELREAYNDLLIMVKTIEEQKEAMYQNQLNEERLKSEQQEIEFKMLASQINPHFLYNTLESLRMKAFTAGDREVANGIKILGKMLRYVLVNIGTTYTTMTKELEHIEMYISIQKLRFGDRVNYSLKIDEGIETDEYMVLPLLLQPIVENAVIHGLEGVGEYGKISIHMYEQESNLKIDIADNGRGMDEKELEQVRDSVNEDSISKHSSIGMANINQRIKLCYGEKYGLNINSRQGVGTTVTVILPRFSVKKEEE